VSTVFRKSDVDDRSDDLLLAMALSGDDERSSREAASVLLGRYREPVYRWCLSRMRDHDRALDLSQDVLISAYRNLRGFNGKAQFSSWLYAIARNRCLNSLRRPSLLDGETDITILPDRQIGQDEELVQQQEEERVLKLIRDHLPPLDQQVLWLRCFEKVPVETITRILEIQEASGARGVLQRARRKLRAVLAMENGSQGGEADV
jgi:RNA polymerase sigma-70 factor, ECF subfamily